MDELHIVDRTELRNYRTEGHVICPGANLYAHRWRKVHITERAKQTLMSHDAYKRWYKYMLRRIDIL